MCAEQVRKGVILIVDDTPANLGVLFNLLRDRGLRVLVAEDGESAIEKANYVHPDLILLDIMMPELDGFETCRLLKEDQNTKDIPVIFMSALSETIDKIKGFEVGGIDYITKPLQHEEVLARVESHLKIKNLTQELQSQNQILLAEIEMRHKVEANLRRQKEQERLIAECSERIWTSLNLDEILKIAVEDVRNFLQTDRVLIYQFSPDWSGEIVVESVSNPHYSILHEIIHDPCFNEHQIIPYRQGKINAVTNIYKSGLKPCYINFLAQYQIKANLVVPILQPLISNESELELEEQLPLVSAQNYCQLSNNKFIPILWGLLIAHHCQDFRSWDKLEIDLLRRLATQMGIAIGQAQLYIKLQSAIQELKKLVALDGLTQLANRRRFDEYLQQEWRRMSREKQPLSLIMCDVDYFKTYNDTYQHLAGDQCLKQIANAINQSVKRPADLVARYGGEEFAIILPNTNINGAIHIAQTIQTQIQQLQIKHNSSPINQYVTLSLGIASIIPDHHNYPDNLIKLADRALYQSKQNGRNQYTISNNS